MLLELLRKKKKTKSVSVVSFFRFFFLLQDVVRQSRFCPSNLLLSGLIGAELPQKKKEGEKGKIIRRLTIKCNLGFLGDVLAQNKQR